jgi:hypothetical protein
VKLTPDGSKLKETTIEHRENKCHSTSTKFALTHDGWVGVTTYRDSEGNVRVKSETLVAMSGITTGNTSYPPFV